jgi:hypothetical protein
MFTDAMNVPGTNFVWAPVVKKKKTKKRRANNVGSSPSSAMISSTARGGLNTTIPPPSSSSSSPRKVVLEPMKKQRRSSRGAIKVVLHTSASAPVLQVRDEVPHERPAPVSRGIGVFGVDPSLPADKQEREQQIVPRDRSPMFEPPSAEFSVTSFRSPEENGLGFEPAPPTLFPELVDMHKMELLKFERMLFLKNKDIVSRLGRLEYKDWLDETRELYRYAVSHLMDLSKDFPHHRRMIGVIFDLYEKLCSALQQLVHTKQQVFRYERDSELTGLSKLNSDLHHDMDALRLENERLQHDLNVERINNRQLVEDLEVHRKFVFVQTGQISLADPNLILLSGERLREQAAESALSTGEQMAIVKPSMALEDMLHADHENQQTGNNFHQQSFEEVRVEMEFVRDKTSDILAELDHRALTRNALTQGFNNTNATETALLTNVAEELEAEMINSTTNINTMFGNMIQFYKAEKGGLKTASIQTDDSELSPNHLYKMQKVAIKPAFGAETEEVDADGNVVAAPQQFVMKKVMRKRRPTIMLKTGRGVSFEREVDPRVAKLQAMQAEKERLAVLGKSRVRVAAAAIEEEHEDSEDEKEVGEELDALYLHFDHFPAYMKRVVCLQQETREELVERFRVVNINFNMTAFGVISFIAQTFMRKIKKQHQQGSRAIAIRRYQQPQPMAEFLYDYLLYKFNTPLKAQKAAIEVTRAAVDLIKKKSHSTKPQVHWFLLFCGYEGHLKLDYPARYLAASCSVLYLDIVACICQHSTYRKAPTPAVARTDSAGQVTAFVIDEKCIIDILYQLRFHFAFGFQRNIVMDTFGHISATQHKSLILPPGFYNNKFQPPDKGDEWWQRLNKRDHSLDELEGKASTSDPDVRAPASFTSSSAEATQRKDGERLAKASPSPTQGFQDVKDAFKYAVGREFFGNLAEVSSYMDPFGKELPGVTGADLLLDHMLWEWVAQRSLLIEVLRLLYQIMTVNQPKEEMSCQEFTTCVKMVFRNANHEEHDASLRAAATKFGLSAQKGGEEKALDDVGGKNLSAGLLRVKEQSKEHALDNGVVWKIYKEVLNKSNSHDAMRMYAFVEVMLSYIDRCEMTIKPYETGVGQTYKSFMDRGFSQELNNDVEQFNMDTLLWDLLWPVGLFAWNQFNYKQKVKALWSKAQEDFELEKANGNRKAKPNMSAAVYLKGLEKQARNSIKKQDIKLVAKALVEMNSVLYKTIKEEDLPRLLEAKPKAELSTLSSLAKTEEGE